MITHLPQSKQLCLQEYLSSIPQIEQVDSYIVTMKPIIELKNILGEYLRTTWGSTNSMIRLMYTTDRWGIIVRNGRSKQSNECRVQYEGNNWPAKCFYILSKSSSIQDLETLRI